MHLWANDIGAWESYDEKPSHPQIFWEPPNMEWKTGGPDGLRQDVVGCASGRGTSPEPITPEINR